MDRSDYTRYQHKVSRRAFVGWGIAGGIVATGGIGFTLSRALYNPNYPDNPGNPGPSYKSTDLYTYEGQAQALAWSPDGTRIAGAIGDTVQIWESANGRRLLTYSDHYKAILSVSWSPDSTRLVTVGWEGTVQVWQASDGKLLWRFPTLPPASAGLPAAAWSPDGAFIVTTGIAVGSVNATTALWDAARGTLIRKYPDQDFYAQRVAWSPDSMRIATGGVNQSVAVWHANSSQKIWEYQGDIATVYGLAWSPDGTRIASCGTKPIVLFASNGGVRIWDATSGKRVLTYRGHSAQADLKALAWSPNGKFIASGGSDQIVQVWNASTGKQVLTYPGHVNQRPMPDLADPYTIWGLAWSPDSTRIVSSAINGPIHVWKISD